MIEPMLLDTDVLVDFFRGHTSAVAFVKNRFDRIVISAITVAELYAGVKGEEEEAILEEILRRCRVVPVTADVARIGGLYRREYGKSHGVGLLDAILAATARSERAELGTLNVKHYPMFKGLKPAYAKA